MNIMEMANDVVVGPEHGFTMSGELYQAGIGGACPDGLSGFVHRQEELLLPPEVHNPVVAAEVLVRPEVEHTVRVADHAGVMLLPEAPRTQPDKDLQQHMIALNKVDEMDLIAAAAQRRVVHPVSYNRTAVLAGLKASAADRRAAYDELVAQHADERAAARLVEPVEQPQELL